MRRKREPTDNRTGIACVACGAELLYTGRCKLHEGTRWSALGDIFELAENRMELDVCKCPGCGRVEFYDMTFKKQ